MAAEPRARLGPNAWRRGGQHSMHRPRRDQIRQKQARIPEMLTPKRRLLKTLVSNLQPLQMAEVFINTPNPGILITSKDAMRSLLIDVYQEQEEKLRQTLHKHADNIVLTCELWFARPEDSYLTVGGHLVDKHGKLQSYMLQTTNLLGDESGANIKRQISAILDNWGIKEKVHTLIRAGMDQLKDVQTEWTHMPCFADILNVIFQDLKSDDKLSRVLRKCHNIVKFFKFDAGAEQKLREIQTHLRISKDELVLYSGDRWLPWLNMLERMSSQYRAMVMVIDERGKTDLILNEDDKKKLNNTISALKILRTATSEMKTQGFETISIVLPLLKTIMESLEKENRTNNVAQMLLSTFKKNFGDIDRNHLAINTFLNPRFKHYLGAENRKQAMDKIMKKLSPRQALSPAKIKDVLERYMNYKPNALDSNPLMWWRHRGKNDFDELSRLALIKLGVVSTAVPLERAFSSEGDRFSNRIRSIEPENLNMILFLHSNWSPTA